MLKRSVLSALTLGAIALAQPAFASFHLMQIEQVIGGVNGDTTRQAIQLRMRTGSQNFVSQGQLVAWDQNGANPVVLLDIPSDVTIGTGGSRVLIATSNFMTGVRDFTMTNPIPASYLARGKITFQSDGVPTDPGTTIWWAVAWGGYTAANTGAMSPGGNDADGNFNPSVAAALPSTNTTALRVTGAAGDLSTNNAAQYAPTAGAATFFNNAGAAQVVPVELMEFKVQ
jgi:hypothetical protein